MSRVGSVGSNSVSLPATTLGVVPYNLIRGTSSTRTADTAACVAASVRELGRRAEHDSATTIVPNPAIHCRRLCIDRLRKPHALLRLQGQSIDSIYGCQERGGLRA